MKRGKSRRRGFTLAEMIMAVALLAIFSVFIVQMFAKADQIAGKARKLDQAVAVTANLAEQWKMDTADTVPAEILDLRNNRTEGRTAVISLDNHFEICEPEKAIYKVEMTVRQALAADDSPIPGVWRLTLAARLAAPSDEGALYTMEASRYFPGEVNGQ